MIQKHECLRVLKMMEEDIETDIKELEGKPFSGPVLAEYLGNTAAAVATLNEIVTLLVEDTEEKE